MTDVRRSRLMDTIGLDSSKYKIISADIDNIVVENILNKKRGNIRY